MSTIKLRRASNVADITEYDSESPSNSGAIATGPCLWIDCLMSNSGSEQLYVFFFDSPSPPGNGAVPCRQPIQLFPGAQTFLDCGACGYADVSGRPMSEGLSWAASTTPNELTLDDTSAVWVTSRTAQ